MQAPAGPRGYPVKIPGDWRGYPPHSPGTSLLNSCQNVHGIPRRHGKTARLPGCGQIASGSVSRLPQWHNPASHGTRMMTRAARSRQASSVAR